MRQFVLLAAPSVGLLLACSLEELDHRRAPRPEVVVVRSPSRSCTGTRISETELVTASSCIAGRGASELEVTSLDGDVEQTVRWVVHGKDPEADGLGDWAILALDGAVAVSELGARHIGSASAHRPPESSTLWWAGVAGSGDRVESGLCRLLGSRVASEIFDSRVIEHDCSFGDVAPGVLLYRLAGDEVRAVALQGGGSGAIEVNDFAHAPVPARDVFVGPEVFVGADAEMLLALDERGGLSRRLRVQPEWTAFQSLSEPKAGLRRIDGAAEARDFVGDALHRVWAVDADGDLHVHSLDDGSWQQDESRRALVDVSLARAAPAPAQVFVLSKDGELCTQRDVETAPAWTCTHVEGDGIALDATTIDGGYFVVTAHVAGLRGSRYLAGEWEPASDFGDDGPYAALTTSTTEQGSVYVVAQAAGRLRMRIGAFDGQSWSDWKPFYASGLSGNVTALTSSRAAHQLEAVYAVVDGEILMSSERPESGIDGAARDPSVAAEFGEWRRIDALRDVDRSP